jgi:hypothetical protein
LRILVRCVERVVVGMSRPSLVVRVRVIRVVQGFEHPGQEATVIGSAQCDHQSTGVSSQIIHTLTLP